MPVNEEKRNEAYDIGELVHGAANIVEQAVKQDDPKAKKALQAAAKALLETAIARMDESVGESVVDEED